MGTLLLKLLSKDLKTKTKSKKQQTNNHKKKQKNKANGKYDNYHGPLFQKKINGIYHVNPDNDTICHVNPDNE